jgi:hypothetical protein
MDFAALRMRLKHGTVRWTDYVTLLKQNVGYCKVDREIIAKVQNSVRIFQ